MSAQRRKHSDKTVRVPEILAIRQPGDDIDIDLDGEPWRCRLVRRDPPLLVLTRNVPLPEEGFAP
jgi:hypothetical protein